MLTFVAFGTTEGVFVVGFTEPVGACTGNDGGATTLSRLAAEGGVGGGNFSSVGTAVGSAGAVALALGSSVGTGVAMVVGAEGCGGAGGFSTAGFTKRIGRNTAVALIGPAGLLADCPDADAAARAAISRAMISSANVRRRGGAASPPSPSARAGLGVGFSGSEVMSGDQGHDSADD